MTTMHGFPWDGRDLCVWFAEHQKDGNDSHCFTTQFPSQTTCADYSQILSIVLRIPSHFFWNRGDRDSTQSEGCINNPVLVSHRTRITYTAYNFKISFVENTLYTQQDDLRAAALGLWTNSQNFNAVKQPLSNQTNNLKVLCTLRQRTRQTRNMG